MPGPPKVEKVEDVEYRLAVPAPHTHLLEVQIHTWSPAGALDLVMPSWTPGSYLLREFPRQVQTFGAADSLGHALRWSKTDKNTWRVEVPAGGTVHLRYTVYANELSVRTSHVDSSHAYINGASVFMYVAGRVHQPCTLAVEPPDGWRVTTSLRCDGGRFQAADYDALVDAPLEIGTHPVEGFDVCGVPHRYAVWGRGSLDAARLVEDTRRILTAAAQFWDGLPYPDYVFLLHLLPGGYGGLEHRDSCSLHADLWAFQGREYEQFLALVAHEHFHAWNGKRLRPAALGPVHYTRENYTRDLWVVEGITTYYTDRILLSAGLVTPARYLERLGELITRVQALPGRQFQSLADSSFDTWIRFYRPDENTPNSQISYYQKGALVALLLDLRIRRLTGGTRSLDDVMRLMWERWGALDVGYPEGALEHAAEEICGSPLRDFFDRYLRSTAELDFAGDLGPAGLALIPGSQQPAAPGGWAARLGVRAREESGHLRITHVLAGTPAHRAGINAGDQLIAINGFRATEAALEAQVAARPPGTGVRTTLFRRDELVTLDVQLETPVVHSVRVEYLPDSTPKAQAIRQAWLHLDPAPAAG